MCIYCIWQILSLVIFEDIKAWVRLFFSIVFVIIVSACFIGDFIGKLVFAIIYNAIWMLGELLTGAVFFNYRFILGRTPYFRFCVIQDITSALN